MLNFTIPGVLWLTVTMAFVPGCGRWNHDAKIIDKGIDDVTKHAAAIDAAAKGGNRPTPEE